MIVKYYNSGDVLSLPLAKSEYEKLWAHNWTERMSQQMKQRFLFMNCIISGHASRGLERRPWRYLMAFDTGHKGQDGKELSGEFSPRASSASAFSLFLDLGAKPMSALDVNFEVLHSRVVCMPGEFCVWWLSYNQTSGSVPGKLTVSCIRARFTEMRYTSICYNMKLIKLGLR